MTSEQYGVATPVPPARTMDSRMPWQLAAAATILFVGSLPFLLNTVVHLVQNLQGEPLIPIQSILTPLWLGQAFIVTVAVALIGMLPFARHRATWIGLLATGGLLAGLFSYRFVRFLLQIQELGLAGSATSGPELATTTFWIVGMLAAFGLLLFPQIRHYLGTSTLAVEPRRLEVKPGAVLAGQIVAWFMAVVATLGTLAGVAALVLPDVLQGLGFQSWIREVAPAAIVWTTSAIALGARRSWARVCVITLVVQAMPGLLLDRLWSPSLLNVVAALVATVIAAGIVVVFARPSVRAWCDQ